MSDADCPYCAPDEKCSLCEDGVPWRVREGDCVEAMRAMPDGSVDAVVCDPPYLLGFMGKAWDRAGGKAGMREETREAQLESGAGWTEKPYAASARPAAPAPGEAHAMQAWHEAWATEALRVLKPGGHLLAFGGTRTYHRLACAVEDAGFEIRDSLIWLYGSGFPKSHDVSKAMDRANGGEPEVVGSVEKWESYGQTNDVYGDGPDHGKRMDVTTPGTPQGAAWEGWGTGLKPGHEPVVVARKPLTGTVAQNVQAHGTGGINIDATRLPISADDRNALGERYWTGQPPEDRVAYGQWETDGKNMLMEYDEGGRWPANVTLTHLPECEQIGTRRVKTNMATAGESQDGQIFGYGNDRGDEPRGHADEDGTEQIPAYRCAPGCPVAELDRQSGERGGGFGTRGGDAKATIYESGHNFDGRVVGYGDHGGASRFFYTAKASRGERNAGLESFPEQPGPSEAYGTKAQHPMKPEGEPNIVLPVRNPHPTVKPIDLMRWLIRLVTPPGGVVLDPFTGSGTTGVACVLEGFRFIGIDREGEYVAIARARIGWWEKHRGRGTAEALGLGLESDRQRREHAESGQMGWDL